MVKSLRPWNVQGRYSIHQSYNDLQNRESTAINTSANYVPHSSVLRTCRYWESLTAEIKSHEIKKNKGKITKISANSVRSSEFVQARNVEPRVAQPLYSRSPMNAHPKSTCCRRISLPRKKKIPELPLTCLMAPHTRKEEGIFLRRMNASSPRGGIGVLPAPTITPGVAVDASLAPKGFHHGWE